MIFPETKWFLFLEFASFAGLDRGRYSIGSSSTLAPSFLLLLLPHFNMRQFCYSSLEVGGAEASLMAFVFFPERNHRTFSFAMYVGFFCGIELEENNNVIVLIEFIFKNVHIFMAIVLYH